MSDEVLVTEGRSSNRLACIAAELVSNAGLFLGAFATIPGLLAFVAGVRDGRTGLHFVLSSFVIMAGLAAMASRVVLLRSRCWAVLLVLPLFFVPVCLIWMD